MTRVAEAAEVVAEPLPWRVNVVDGDTEKPIQGVPVAFVGNVGPNGESTLVTDEQGEIIVFLRPGDSTALWLPNTSGFWARSLTLVGDRDDDKDGELDSAPREEPRHIKAWRGTIVRGRLLDPDGEPVADAPIVAGVHLDETAGDEQPKNTPRVFQTWDRGQWPNWETTAKTADDGTFNVTVPPTNARSYIRLGTRDGGFRRIDTDRLAGQNPDHVLVRFAPLLFDIKAYYRQYERPLFLVKDDGSIDVGDIRLHRGVVLYGRVLDSAGQPLSGVHLYTSTEHGPLAGRTTVSREDGSYRFAPMEPGELQLTPDATLRGPDGEQNSRDVQAVFVPMPVRLPDDADDVEFDLRAFDHVDLEFEWVDRRAEKGPIAYYGTHPVSGRIPVKGGDPLWWRGETFLVERDGKPFLTMKAPRNLIDAKIQLARDSRVTATLEDTDGVHGPGSVPLGDITKPARRKIYADEPLE